MHPAIIFIFGMVAGGIITFFSIILFAETMDKKEKERLINIARSKRKSG